MSSTNKTAHYELPQFVENDIFNPLVDDNDAYSKIDTALYNIADAEADDAAEIVGIKSRLDTAEGKVDALETQNGTDVLTTVAQTLSGAVNELKSGEDSLDGRLDVVEDAINNATTGLSVKVAALETQNGSEILTTTAQTLSGAVNELNSDTDSLATRMTNVEDEVVSKDDITIGNVTLTRYKFPRYLVDIIKVPYLKKDGIHHNIPIVVGDNTLQHIQDLVKNSKVAVNIGYFTIDGTNQSIGSILSEGVQHVGDILNDPDTCYLAIGDDGSLREYPYTTPIADIANDGYNNAASVRCNLVKNGIVNPNNPITRFMQQLFGIDNDNNYYFITTSYFCDLSSSQQITWVMSVIPNLKDLYALDSGGSTQTYMCGKRTNLESDITSDGMGRKVVASLLIPVDNDGDVNTLANMFINDNNLSPKKLFYQRSGDVPAGTNLEVWHGCVYQIGNLVFGTLGITTKAGYDGSWTALSYFNDMLPKADEQINANGLQASNNNPLSCELRMQYNSTQTSTDSNLEFRAPAVANVDVNYNVSFMYATKQNV